MQRHDYASAQAMLSDYVKGHPQSVQVRLQLGLADIAMKKIDDAIEVLRAAKKIAPDEDDVLSGLVLAYAQKGDWAAFDRERAKQKLARAAHKAIPAHPEGGDIIDLLVVDGQQYTVKAYEPPMGPHHSHYVFLHVVNDTSVTDLFTCDSDDGDQFAFRQDHPKEAASGARRFSLDPWVVAENGGLEHQHVLALYDGEPTYKALRADVIAALAARAKQGKNDKPQ